VRPVRHKAKSQGHTIDKALDSEDEEPSDEDVEDSEAGKGPINTSTLPPDVSIEDEDIDASEFSPPTNGSDHAKGQPKSRAKPSTPEDQGKTRTEKAPRKGKTNANATSHANFRRLKLRNRNSKGAGGGGGRYGRGRR
jgi:DNA replication regulator SLD2